MTAKTVGPTVLISEQVGQLKRLVLKTAMSIARKLPFASDYYNYYWQFPRRMTACRGVYHSFAEALQSLPSDARMGHNQSDIHEHEAIDRLTSGWALGEFNPQDYPVLVWLGSAFRQSLAVFDFGGNLGQAYYAYRKYLQYPQDLRWLVCEVPEIVKAGERLATQSNSPGLSFTDEFTDIDEINILLTGGTLQYLETSLADMLKPMKSKPHHILINQMPLYDGKSFVTLQNIGYAFTPYKIWNRAEFIATLESVGYELVDSWSYNRTCSIPFHPDRFVSAYHGMYFRFGSGK